jgi:hypothetical protein
MPRIFFLLLFPVGAFAAASATDLEFNGVVVTATAEGEKTSVSLLNTATGTSKWVAIGGKFDGLTVTAFRPGNPTATPPTSDSILLIREGTKQSLSLTLKNSVILPAQSGATASGASGSLTNAQRNAVLGNLRMIMTAAEQYFLESGFASVTFEQLVGPEREKYIKSFAAVAGESYSGMVIESGRPISTTVGGTTVSFGP